jgi:hypothetical protein
MACKVVSLFHQEKLKSLECSFSQSHTLGQRFFLDKGFFFFFWLRILDKVADLSLSVSDCPMGQSLKYSLLLVKGLLQTLALSCEL